MPSLPPLSELPSPIRNSSPDTVAPLLSHNSQPEISRSSFTLNAAPTLRRNASIAPTANRQPALTVQSQKKRLSTIGTSSSPGRLYKMLGDFFLLAGRSEDALIWYVEFDHSCYFCLELSIGTMRLLKYSETQTIFCGMLALWREWRQRPWSTPGRLVKVL